MSSTTASIRSWFARNSSTASLPALRGQDLEAQVLENSPAHAEDHRLVVHEQHRAGARDDVPGKRRRRHDRLSGSRECDREGRTVRGDALHRDRAAVIPHDAVGRGETETRSPPPVLGREKWLENPLPDRGVDAGPGVPHRDRTYRPGADSGRGGLRLVKVRVLASRRTAAAPGHRLPGVDEEVEQHLLELRPVDLHRARSPA